MTNGTGINGSMNTSKVWMVGSCE